MPYWLRITQYDVEYINNSCPSDLEPYAKAHEQEANEKDMFLWLNGRYTQQALLSTVCNLFREKGQEAFEYPEKPLTDKTELNEYGEVELTEEEKKMWRERLLIGLKIKQSNFEASKREGGK